MTDPVVPPAVAAGLPEAYVRALEAVHEGADDATIAERCDVDVAAVGPLLRLAIVKLLDAQRAAPVDPGREPGARGNA